VGGSLITVSGSPHHEVEETVVTEEQELEAEIETETEYHDYHIVQEAEQGEEVFFPGSSDELGEVGDLYSSSESPVPSSHHQAPHTLLLQQQQQLHHPGHEGGVARVIEVEDGTGNEEFHTYAFDSDEQKFLMDSTIHNSQVIELEDPSRPFECELCKKQFTKIEILKRHIKTHMKEKEFKCSYCTKTFDRRDVLNDHVRNHTGEKPFECPTCKKKFTRGFVLLRHQRTHNAGVYKCDFCMKSFDRKDTFRDHLRNHTGEKPFKCRFCGKCFSRSFVLTKHEKSHVIREELAEDSFVLENSDTVMVEDIDYRDDESVEKATDLLLEKDFVQEVISSDNVEQEIIQAGEDFNIIEEEEVPMEENLVCEPAVEEVVETEAITLATADGQIVRVISKEQYDRLLVAAGKQRTWRCNTCNKTFTSQALYQHHFTQRWELGGCIGVK